MSIAGSWNLLVETPFGREPMTLRAEPDGSVFTGTLTAKGATVDIIDGQIESGTARWKARFTRPFALALEFEAALTGDQLSGVVRAGNLGAAAVAGERAA